MYMLAYMSIPVHYICFATRPSVPACFVQHGWTALHDAARRGYLPVVEVLLANGAAVESRDKVSAIGTKTVWKHDRDDLILPTHTKYVCSLAMCGYAPQRRVYLYVQRNMYF
jgi:Ankyrin repeat